MMSGKNSTEEHLPSSGFFIAMTIFAILCIIFGLLGNVGVIVYNIFMKYPKTATTYFVVNLAISDAIVCMTFFPPWLFEYMAILTDRKSNHRLFCEIAMTSSYTSIALSIANLLTITIDRWIFITKPLRYPRVMTLKKTHIVLAVIWILAIVNANVVFFNTKEVTGRRLFCRIDYPEQYLLTSVNFYIPCVGIFFLNYKIYKVAKAQRRRIQDESYTTQEPEAAGNSQKVLRREHLQQMKTVKTFAIILGAFICCVFPRLILSMRKTSSAKFISYHVSVSATMLMGANSVINPFIYGTRNKEYRIAYRRFISRLFEK